MRFREKKGVAPEEKPDKAVPSDPSEGQESIEASLSSAQDELLRDGPESALEHLKGSPYLRSERVVKWMHALVWNNRDKLQKDFLEEPFLDAVWCQCTACEFTWLISPLLALQPASYFVTKKQPLGLECTACQRVLCPQCATAVVEATCPCGGTFSAILKPNGRKRRKLTKANDERDAIDPYYAPPERPPNAPEGLHLYFGFEGRVPVGIDPAFPSMPPVDAEAHVGWAETLLNCGVYYQALQQLDLLSAEKRFPAKAKWLRARLKLIQLHNAKERLRRRKDFSLGRPEWLDWPEEIKELLAAAVAQAPDLGGAWLTLAEVNLDGACGVDYPRALECAEQAQRILGQTPRVLLALGQALRATERPAEAVAALRLIPHYSAEGERVRLELKLAELEARCLAEPVDVAAHLELGRWWIRQNADDKAQRIFERLRDERPDRPEGYYGLARLAFTDREKPLIERYTEVYDLCREALNHDPKFGLAYELLGSLFHNVSRGMGEGVAFKVEDSLEYYRRAIQCDPTCDIALRYVAESDLKKGQLHPAKEMLEQAAALDTNDAGTYYVLAVIYQGTRDFLKAEEAYRKAKELWPEVELDADYKQEILRVCGYEY